VIILRFSYFLVVVFVEHMEHLGLCFRGVVVMICFAFGTHHYTLEIIHTTQPYTASM
jgi:predicted tellurium resistance membrane protein TerC